MKKIHIKTRKKIEFECRNCLNVFNFEYQNICFDKFDDIQFSPEPACPNCGNSEKINFSDFSQIQIEKMIFRNQIKKCK